MVRGVASQAPKLAAKKQACEAIFDLFQLVAELTAQEADFFNELGMEPEYRAPRTCRKALFNFRNSS